MAKTTAMTKYSAEWAEYAQKQIAQEKNVGGGKMITTAGGIMKANGNAIPGNQIAVIIVDNINENRYFGNKAYDPDNPQSPICYAHGRDDDTMAPEPKNVTDPQNDDCASCQWNVYGSAETGNGKACKNGRRLAVLSIGNLDKQGNLRMLKNEDILKGEVMYIALPPTAIKPWAAYAKEVLALHGRPPFGVMTRIAIRPDQKTQIAWEFECLEAVDDKLTPGVFKLHADQEKEIFFPYPKNDPEAEQPKRKSAGGRGRAASSGGGRGAARAEAPAQTRSRTRVVRADDAEEGEAPRAGSSRRKASGAQADDAPAEATPRGGGRRILRPGEKF